MSPKGVRHEVVKHALQEFWIPRAIGSPVRVMIETTLYVGVDEFCEPDFLLVPRATAIEDVTPASAFLIVEIADSSLQYDLRTKAALYARRGVREYWVVNAQTLRTVIHRRPADSGYAGRMELEASERLIPEAVPALAVTLAELDLG